MSSGRIHFFPASGDCRDTVVAHVASDDLSLVGLTTYMLVHPRQFDICFVCLRAGAGKQYLAHGGRQNIEQAFAESDLLLMRIAAKGVEIRELVGLLADRVGDLAAPVPGVYTKQGGHRIYIGIALVVGHVDAVA